MLCPKISVIVPIYNMELTLARCLDSLLSQSYANYELLLVNDGSTDKSGDICHEYALKDDRIKVFYKKNGGVSSARNMGIDNASSEWITTCDPDDVVKDDWLDIFVRNSENTDLVIQGYMTDKSNFVHGIDYAGDAKGAFMALFSVPMRGSIWTKVFRRDIINKNNLRFNESFIFREDEEFVLRYLNIAGRVTSTKDGAYIYYKPDLTNKYSHADMFYCSCSMFQSVRRLMGTRYDEFCKAYHDELDRALFFSFTTRKKDRSKRVELYQQIVGSDVMYSSINLFSKILLFCIHSPKVVSMFFDLKARNIEYPNSYQNRNER